MFLNEHVGKFIQKHNLLSRDVHLLLAVSGGVDSMVLLDLLCSLDLRLAVAHVNYRLREASDEEHQLVRHRSLMKNITCHTYEANDEEREAMKSGNLQEKAREIRYGFFSDLKKEYGYTHLVTAHHLDDQVEGFFLRALRSSGLEGLTGMTEAEPSGLLRPLLGFPKSELYAYAKAEGIPFLDDVTNFSSDYDRNFIRNDVLPIIEKRFPEYRKAISSTISHLKDNQDWMTYVIGREANHFSESLEDGLKVLRLAELRKIPGSVTFLWHLIRSYGFNASMSSDMLRSDTGAMFYSFSHYALVDRDTILIRPINQTTETEVIINEMGIHEVNDGLDLLIKEVEAHEVNNDPNVEYFDLEKVTFPLKVRPWRPGDRFRPIGMKGRSKKVKDFLTDMKVPRTDKSRALVITSGGEIIWIIGHRMDDRAKVTSNTHRKLMMKMLQSASE